MENVALVISRMAYEWFSTHVSMLAWLLGIASVQCDAWNMNLVSLGPTTAPVLNRSSPPINVQQIVQLVILPLGLVLSLSSLILFLRLNANNEWVVTFNHTFIFFSSRFRQLLIY